MSATIRDVARVAKVSVASVSRVMNGDPSVSHDMRSRVLEAAGRLRYVPHAGARSLSTSKSGSFGILLPEITTCDVSDFMRGAHQVACELKRTLLISSFPVSEAAAGTAIRNMYGRVDGLLLVAQRAEPACAQYSHPVDLPILLVDSRPSSSYRVVGYKHAQAAANMVRHLRRNRRKSVAHIAGPSTHFKSCELIRGYLHAIGRKPPECYVVEGDLSFEAGYDAGKRLANLRPLPQAIFAASDNMAAGCMHAFAEMGIDVPREVAITGYGDAPFSSWLSCPLTTMRACLADLAGTAIRHLAAAANGTNPQLQHCWSVPELRVRRSCGLEQRIHQASSASDA